MFSFFSDGEERMIRPASTEKISKYAHISRHFLIHVLGLEPEQTFISDLSSLTDFLVEDEVLEREIFLHYGIEIEETEGVRLVDVFKRIEEEGIVPG